MRFSLAMTVVSLAIASAVQAQAPASTRDTTRDSTRTMSFFTATDPWIALAFAAGTIAMAPLDRHIAQELQRPETQARRNVRRTAEAFNFLGDPGTILIGVSMYAAGRVGRWNRVADLGLHGTEAVIASGGITGLVKILAGRERPNVAGTNDADDFQLGRGAKGNAYESFPSGHTAVAFAAATAVISETSRWWPGSARYVGPVMYGGATLVAAARLYTNAHWMSDVVMGAGIGTFTGIKVVRFNHTRAGNRLDRWLLGAVPVVTPNAGASGATLTWSFQPGR